MLARSPEQLLWDRTRPLLAGLDPVRVENDSCPGTPDVNCVLGWIELKVVSRKPRSAQAVVKVPHFRPAQRAWLTRRARSGGACWMLLKLGPWVILLEGGWAAKNVGRVSSNEMLEHCVGAWYSNFGPAVHTAFRQALRNSARIMNDYQP